MEVGSAIGEQRSAISEQEAGARMAAPTGLLNSQQPTANSQQPTANTTKGVILNEVKDLNRNIAGLYKFSRGWK